MAHIHFAGQFAAFSETVTVKILEIDLERFQVRVFLRQIGRAVRALILLEAVIQARIRFSGWYDHLGGAEFSRAKSPLRRHDIADQ